MTVAGFGRKEIAHTAVLAWLLNPRHEHGLGSAFLARFLDALGLPAADLAGVGVTVEEIRGHRRADIVLRLSGRIIVIEAKVDADERPAQCDDLFALFGSTAEFVFLTPSGHRPWSASGRAAESFRCLSFAAIRDALELESTSAAFNGSARGASAVRTYLDTLNVQFPRSQPVEINARVRFYFENRAILDEWAGLADEARHAAHSFFQSLRDPVEGLARRLGDDVHVYADLEGNFPKLMLFRGSWGTGSGAPKVAVGLEWHKGGAAFDKGYTGVWVDRRDGAGTERLYTAVCRELDAEGVSKKGRDKWWPASAYQAVPPGTWWTDLPAFREQLVNRIEAQWELLSACVDDALASP